MSGNTSETADASLGSQHSTIRWDQVRADTVGTRTFEDVLYDPELLEERAPAYYRTGKHRNGDAARRATPVSDRFPPVEAVVDFTEAANRTGAPEQRRELVAVTPTTAELEEWKDEFDDERSNYEPAFTRVPFYDKRIVGNVGLSAAYGLVIKDSFHSDEPTFDYDWEADYESGDVTITVEEVTN